MEIRILHCIRRSADTDENRTGTRIRWTGQETSGLPAWRGRSSPLAAAFWLGSPSRRADAGPAAGRATVYCGRLGNGTNSKGLGPLGSYVTCGNAGEHTARPARTHNPLAVGSSPTRPTIVTCGNGRSADGRDFCADLDRFTRLRSLPDARSPGCAHRVNNKGLVGQLVVPVSQACRRSVRAIGVSRQGTSGSTAESHGRRLLGMPEH